MNATFVELVFTLGAIIGVIVTVAGVHDALVDVLVARRSASHAKRKERVAAQTARNEVMRVFILLFFLALGTQASLEPGGVTLRDTVHSLAALGLVITNALLIVLSILDRRDRDYILNYDVENGDTHAPATPDPDTGGA